MLKLQIFLFAFLGLNMQTEEPNIEKIYVGKTFKWTVYFDANKVPKVVEVGGIKFGYLDYLKSVDKNKGELYHKNGKLHYKNESLNINVKLEQKKYTSKIDNQRLKIFETNAFAEVSKLKDSLDVKNYMFDWNVRDDYIFYRDNNYIPDDYQPGYIRRFHNSLKH